MRMKDNELTLIFGKTSVWDFLINNKHMESLQYDTHNNFITNNGAKYIISNIRVCMDSGVLSFEKTSIGSKAVKASLVFIRDKSILVGVEGNKQVKYIKTNRKSFSL
jgi:hypothetical protein